MEKQITMDTRNWVKLEEGVYASGTKKRFTLMWHGLEVRGCKIFQGRFGLFIKHPFYVIQKPGEEAVYHAITALNKEYGAEFKDEWYDKIPD